MRKKILTKLSNNKKKVFEVMAILLIILFAVSISPKTLQNDTFYTVTIGELITENGIDMKDHFSWNQDSSGNSLPYTYPHWLYDVGMYFIYNLGGWQGIYISTCVLSAILGICIYKVNSKLSKSQLISFVITIVSLCLLKGYIAARAQLVTFTLFILLVYNIEKFVENKKIRNAVALFIIQTLIANLHAAVWPFAFVLYLPYIAEYIICELIDILLYHKIKVLILKRKIKSLQAKLVQNPDNQKIKEKIEILIKKLEELESRVDKVKARREENLENPYKIKLQKNTNVRWLIVVMIITIFTGFLTPIGATPFTYTLLISQGNTMDNINEHLPLTLAENTPILCTLMVYLAILIFTKVKIKLSDLFMIGGLAYLMLITRRQSSMFILIGSIVLTRLVSELIEIYCGYNRKELTKKFFNEFTAFILIFTVLLCSLNFFDKKKNDPYIRKTSYPVEASEWILNNLDVENIRLYNEYNYGSYLLYKGIPVFIDSRSDLYTPEFNTETGNSEDGQDIFSDFLNSSNIGTYYGKIFEKYEITHILLYKTSKINLIIENADSEKYNLIYSDNSFVIYEVLNY